MKLKSKGTFWHGYRRLYLKQYGQTPFIEFQFNPYINGLGISWQIDKHSKFITLNLILIEFTLAI